VFKQSFAKLANVSVLILLLWFGSILLNSQSSSFNVANAQTNRKTITNTPWPNMPVEFVKVTVAGTEVKLGEAFENGDEWFKGFTLTIKNTSMKEIKYFDLYLDFPETKASGPLVLSNLIRYGRYEGLWESGNDVSLKPGDETEIKISDTLHSAIKYHVEKRCPVKSLTNMNILLQTVMFEDDTMWYGGSLLHRESPGSKRFVH